MSPGSTEEPCKWLTSLCLFVCLFLKLHHRCSHLLSWAWVLAAAPCKRIHIDITWSLTGNNAKHTLKALSRQYILAMWIFVTRGCLVNHCEWFFFFFFLRLLWSLSFSPACPHRTPRCRFLAVDLVTASYVAFKWWCQPFFISNCCTIKQF